MNNRTSVPALAWGAATDTGRVRPENEDAFICEPMIFGVADGMGGHQAGEVASALAAGTLRDRLSGGAPTVDVAVAAVVEANAAIFQGAHSNLDQRGMGTTLTAMVVLHDDDGARLAVLNVGDSRTYVLRNGRLRRVTIDHSYVQELVSTGHITEAEARNHPRRNIVTRALGIEPSVRVDTWVLPFVRGDRYVLCSDGLVDEVDDDEIASVLAVHPSPQAAAEGLVAAANRNGGRDNVTVVVVDSLEGMEPPPDSADLDLDLAWDEQQAPHLPDGAGGSHGAPPPGSPVTTDPTPLTLPMPSRRQRMKLGPWLFGLGVVVIAALTLVLVLVVRDGADDSPATSSTARSSTSTTVRSSTTVRTTTTLNTSTVKGSTTTGGG